MFSQRYPSNRRLKVVANIFLLTFFIYLGFVCAKESQNRMRNLKASNDSISSGNSRPVIDRRERVRVKATDVTNSIVTTRTTTTSRRRQSLDDNNDSNITSGQQNYPLNEDKDDYRVPFWNIAHMINSIEEIELATRNNANNNQLQFHLVESQFGRAGANGIETDISFDRLGQPVETFHGFPCDCGRHCYSRESFVKFIQHIGDITTPPATSYPQLVVLDLKLKDLNANQKLVAGKQMAAIIDEFVYRKYLIASKELKQQQEQQNLIIQPPVRFIISINHVHDNVLIRSFLDYMLENRLEFMSKYVGFDVGMNDNLTDISSMWDQFNGITMNIWQGDGLTNCANIIRGVERLKQAISIRNGQGHFKKVYYWTADVMYLIRSVLRFGLDALLTNQPQRVVQVLQEPEFNSKYRLATAYDDPFAQFWIKPSSWSVSIPTFSEAIETVANIRKTGEQYVKTLPTGIAVALQKVQESIIPG